MTHRFLPHTGDIRVRIEAESRAALYDEATQIVGHLLAAGPVAARDPRSIVITGDGSDELLVGFLNELVYQFDVDRRIPARVELESIDATSLRARVWGEYFDPERHDALPEVKAVTRHQLALDEVDGIWRAELVFDV